MNPRHTRQTDTRYFRRGVMSPSRARWARRATIGVTVLLVAALILVACRLAGILIFDWLGHGAFSSQQYAQAEDYYGANTKLNIIEPWIASYDRGTVRSAESNYTDAEKDLRAALKLAPEGQKCRVSMNLVWTMEESVTMHSLNPNRGPAMTADTLKEAKAIAQRLKCHGKTTAPQSYVRQTSADQKTEQSTTMKRLNQGMNQAQQGSQSQENKTPKKKDSEQQRQKNLSTRNQQALNEQRRNSQEQNRSPQQAPSAPTAPRTAGGAPDKKGW